MSSISLNYSVTTTVRLVADIPINWEVLRKRGAANSLTWNGKTTPPNASDSVDIPANTLAAGNQAYEARFGHIYLVCAAGRSATELLAILQARLANDPETERQVMRGELIKINDLRLAQLIGTEAP